MTPERALRTELLERTSTEGIAAGPDPVRFATRKLAARMTREFEQHWAEGRMVNGPIDVIDMFSGCGGMSAGFLAANGMIPAFRLAMAVDIDTVANETFAHNLGVTPHAEDLSVLARDQNRLDDLLNRSRRRRGHPLVLIGCAPCQGFSSHRNAAGEKDPRNALFVDFARVATQIDPDVIVVENVPELLTERYWPVVEEGRNILEEAGFFVYLGVHNMAAFGVPQERFRTLLLASKKGFAPPEGILPRSDFRTVRDAIGDLPEIAPGERIPGDPVHFTAKHRASTVQVIQAVPKDGGNRPHDVGPECLRRAGHRQGKPAYEDVYGRLHWDRPAITITAYARNPASGRFVHPEQDRGLSAREAALLQGFPRSYWFAGTLDEKFRQIGNAVPPRFAACLALHILGELLSGSTEDDLNCDGIKSPVGKSFSRLIPSLKAADTRNLTAMLNARG